MPKCFKVARSLLLSSLFALLVAPAQQPQDSPEPNRPVAYRTFGEMNGRAWRGFSEDLKTAYLEGINAAFGTAVIQTKPP